MVVRLSRFWLGHYSFRLCADFCFDYSTICMFLIDAIHFNLLVQRKCDRKGWRICCGLFSLGKRELVYVIIVHFARVNFCPFSLTLGVRFWLRLLMMALPGLFYQRFYMSHVMRKPVFTICEQQRRRSACTPVHLLCRSNKLFYLV